MNKPPITDYMIETNGRPSKTWVAWFTSVFAEAATSGTTANRPTTGLYVGRFYFDETLGKPIWLKSVRPTVWVLADGTVA